MSDSPEEQGFTKTLPIVVGAESEIGRREENQDHMTGFMSRFGSVYVVADGMGGHRGGAAASRMVTEGLRTHLLAASLGTSLAQALGQAARLTNADVFEKSNSGDPHFAGMGSTLSLAVIGETDSGVALVTAHVGDSRVYLDRGGHLSLLTKDHTYVQRLVDANMIDAEAARTHPEASVLTRAMGQAADVAIDIGEPVPLSDGDGILLCSDGLSGYVPREAIEDTVHRHPEPSECAKALIELALASGSDDNITVQFVRFGDAPALSAAPPKRRRKTWPESEALPAPAAEGRTGRSYILFACLALALPLCAAGVYAFRASLFPPAPVVSGESAPQGSRIDRLKTEARELHERAAKDRSAAQAQLNSELSNELQGYEDETRTLEAQLGDPAKAKSVERKIKVFQSKLKMSEAKLSRGRPPAGTF